jgi:hypothetical protein
MTPTLSPWIAKRKFGHARDKCHLIFRPEDRDRDILHLVHSDPRRDAI